MSLLVNPWVFDLDVFWLESIVLLLSQQWWLTVVLNNLILLSTKRSVVHGAVDLVSWGLVISRLVWVGGLSDWEWLWLLPVNYKNVLWIYYEKRRYLFLFGFSKISFYICSYWLLMCWKSGTVSFWIGPRGKSKQHWLELKTKPILTKLLVVSNTCLLWLMHTAKNL